MRKKIFRGILIFFTVILAAIGGFVLYAVWVSDIKPPDVSDEQQVTATSSEIGKDSFIIAGNFLRKTPYGLWELYITGSPYQRGVIEGRLTKQLVIDQEVAFSNQIDEFIPSKSYKHFLKYLIGIFNRNLSDYVPEENKKEIYGISQSASDEFKSFGTNYSRILNYHAAHDIGHALQNAALVGCSSFAVWGNKSLNNDLVIGRNFDFYINDLFAKDKIVAFYKPDKGFPFMMVTWGGMTGVCSGMNTEGVTVTLNAAKSEMPTSSATPISILAREILQYAQNIDQAYKIARSHKTFVSESLLIGSARDRKAAIIEKTPDTIALYESNTNQLVCTNHFQSPLFENQPLNVRQKEESSSVYRYERIEELLTGYPKLSYREVSEILRNRQGKQNADIGIGNEKAVNQFICHHSIIFEPEKLLVWVSQGPWAEGEYVAYDLNTVFGENQPSVYTAFNIDSLKVGVDTFTNAADYKNFLTFRSMKSLVKKNKAVDIEKFVSLNPEYYDTYIMAGNYYYKNGKKAEARAMFQKAMTKEIANKNEKDHCEKMIKTIDEETGK